MFSGHSGVEIDAVHVSLNELALTSYKATLGIGASMGAAEDMGRAVTWLSLHGLSSVSLVIRAVRNVEDGHSVYGGVNKDKTGTYWKPDIIDKHLASALLGSGPATLCVSLVTKDRGNLLSLVGLDEPLLLLPHFAEAARIHELSFFIRSYRGKVGWYAFCNSNGVSISNDNYNTEDDLHMEVSCVVGGCTEAPKGVIYLMERNIYEHGCSVDPDEWKCLSRYADKILVDATKRSRTLGAGAGLSDND